MQVVDAIRLRSGNPAAAPDQPDGFQAISAKNPLLISANSYQLMSMVSTAPIAARSCAMPRQAVAKDFSPINDIGGFFGEVLTRPGAPFEPSASPMGCASGAAWGKAGRISKDLGRTRPGASVSEPGLLPWPAG
jgi:hypothetical protein